MSFQKKTEKIAFLFSYRKQKNCAFSVRLLAIHRRNEIVNISMKLLHLIQSVPEPRNM